MAKRPKKKKFSAATAVKSAARNIIGSPRPTRQVMPKTEKSQDKHKLSLSRLLAADE
jgi:hypothetical protein